QAQSRAARPVAETPAPRSRRVPAHARHPGYRVVGCTRVPDEATATLDEQLVHSGALVDEWTRAALADSISPQAERLRAMLEYHLGWRDEHLQPLKVSAPAGKKLRPALVLLVAQAVSGEINDAARDAAVAVEPIQNFSLVHDDIQVHSELRRHRRTLLSLWS